MKVVIVGCGQVGGTLAYELYKMGHQVVMIDQDERSLNDLPEDFKGRTITGDVLTEQVLQRAELQEAGAFFALTSSDPLNALIAHIASTEYGVPTVAARNNHPRQLALQKAFGITVIGTPGWRADNLVDMLSGEAIRAFRPDPNAELVIYKIVVPEKWAQIDLRELLPMDKVDIIQLMRSGDELPVDGAQLLLTGDQIFLKADAAVIDAMRDRLNSTGEK
jgi:trk system potassium uptake protein TrkA